MAGVDKVAHLVGVITEKGSQRFDGVIRGGTANVVSEAEKAGVKKLVYVSAIGAAPDPQFPYWHAKWQAEQAVTASSLNYTILRPSLVFGPEDDFFNRLERLVRRTPVVPVAGNGKTRFQPIWVEDVVSCVVACLSEGTHDREIVEIGGPEYYSYDEIIDLIRQKLGSRKPKVHMPLWLMRPAARVLQAVLPSPPVTTDQLAMLSKDNITALDAVPKAFGFAPKSLREGLGAPRAPIPSPHDAARHHRAPRRQQLRDAGARPRRRRRRNRDRRPPRPRPLRRTARRPSRLPAHLRRQVARSLLPRPRDRPRRGARAGRGQSVAPRRRQEHERTRPAFAPRRLEGARGDRRDADVVALLGPHAQCPGGRAGAARRTTR